MGEKVKVGIALDPKLQIHLSPIVELLTPDVLVKGKDLRELLAVFALDVQNVKVVDRWHQAGSCFLKMKIKVVSENHTRSQ